MLVKQRPLVCAYMHMDCMLSCPVLQEALGSSERSEAEQYICRHACQRRQNHCLTQQ